MFIAIFTFSLVAQDFHLVHYHRSCLLHNFIMILYSKTDATHYNFEKSQFACQNIFTILMLFCYFRILLISTQIFQISLSYFEQ